MSTPAAESREVAGRYRLERVLGRGGMGSVHLARDLKLSTYVAVKLAQSSGVAEEAFRARFAREARIGNHLGKHEGFVRAFDWGEAAGGRQLYLAMDLVADGRPLDLRPARPLAAKLGALASAARLVARAHALGVVHRDLKPGNLLETPDGQVFLADFGLARLDGAEDAEGAEQEAVTGPGQPLGTPAYMPPEQFADGHGVDARADVYALGVMLFQALTGRLPFEGRPQEAQRAVLAGTSRAPRPRDHAPDVPQALDVLCAQALALDRERRVASAEVFLRGLVAAGGLEAARGSSELEGVAPERVGHLELEVTHASRVCFAMDHCGVPVVEVVRVVNDTWAPIEHAQLRLELAPDLGALTTIELPPLLPGDAHELDDIELRPAADRLRTLEERERATLRWSLASGAHVHARGEADVEVLAANEWPGEGAPPQLLAVFVTPNHPVVGRVLARVRDRLVAAGAAHTSFTGYEDRAPGLKGRVRATVCALYETLQALGITYAPAPASFEREGQKVRFADALLRDRLGNCLDLSLLFAACLEQMALHPLVVVVEGHAVAGVWLQDDPVGLQGGLAEDAARVRNLRALDHVLLVDVTAAATPGGAPARTFDEALLLGDRALDDDARFRVALDVHALRDPRYGFRPLPLRALARLDAEEDADADGGGAAPPVDEVRRILAEAALEAPPEPDGPAPVASPPRTIAVTPARFRRWQDRLLDLTLRNKLLAFSLKARGALPLEVPDLAAFEDRLAKNEAFDLVPRPEPLEGAVATKPDPEQLRAARAAELARGRLQTGMLADDLFARGRHLVSEARLGLEEGGATTLYVAVGLLRWIDPEGDQRLAPLVLYPARLELDRRRRALRLRRIDDEDPVGNVTLREKVRRDHGLDLSILDAPPQDEAGIDVRALLTAVREAIRPLPRWEVLDEAHVGLFTFTKFLMWRDLRDHQEALLESDVVSRIAATKTTPAAPDGVVEGVAPEQLDAQIDPATLPFVVDADATQTSAIVSALRGRSFVLQGPPGTGKSQTITNLIASGLAAGKTVLFVSEKMAALEVVHRRLEAAGLGDFCLELHSHKTSKKEVLASLRRALDRAERQAAVPWAERSRELGKLRDDLNAYVRALHAPRPIGLSFHEGRARLLELAPAKTIRLERGEAAPGAKLARRALEVTASELQVMLEATSALAERARVVGAPGEHPFRESGLAEWSEATQRAVREAAEDVLPALDAVEAAALALVEAPDPTASLSTTALAAVASFAATASARPSPAALRKDDAVARAVATEVEQHAAALDQHAGRRAKLAVRWADALYQADLAALAPRFASYQASWSLTRWFMLGSARTALRPHAKGELPTDDVVARDLTEALALAGEAPALAARSQEVASRLDGAWQETTGAAGLRAALAHARAVQAARAKVLAAAPGLDPVLDQLTERRRTDLRAAADALHAALVALERAETAARTSAAVPVPDGKRWPKPAQAEHRGRLRDTAERWLGGLRRLREWCFYREAVVAAAALDLSFLVAQHAQGALAPDDLAPAFERWLLERWVEAARDQEPALRRFDGPEHHRRVDAFAQKDAAHLELARRYVVATLEARLPTPAAVVAETSELGRLRRELKKQRGHLAVRQLLRELPELLPRLKACMLMSPLSVAQYLPADGKRFDLVVFDEASQIPTHEAIGAMARGDQVVVVGDSRQLPPTTFFQRAQDEETDVEDEAELAELESVLDEAVASQLPEQTLGWHYRSRHESLIEFSNRHYYDERLTIFPAARAAQDVGVRWHPVPTGVYGGSDDRTNHAEAEALVAHLVASLRATPAGARSFGVVTFNRPQQELIEALLDEARARHPELEAHFAAEVGEPVFVKNLENVQGDERDEVLFSVTYAKDAAGRLRMHFGPLSIAGGERRLNVAITRARRQLHVFATLTADQIDLSRTRAKGTEHLRLFLEFAARRGAAPEALAGAPGDGIKGPLERDVHAALTELGYAVRPWVGCGRIRIDLGVVDPQRPDEYLLGVECDGGTYCATPTARDRDRLRRQVLAGLGWRMHRVWLLDWCEDRAREVERLKAALAAAVEDAARRAADEVARATSEAQVDGPVETPAEADAGDAVTGALAPPSPSAAPTVQAPQATYVVAPARVVSATSDDLFQPKALRALYDRIEEVVRAEGPVHVDLLVRRVLDAWSWPRVTPRAKARVLAEGVETLRHAGKVDVRGEWVWRPAQQVVAFRTGGERKAEHVAPEEVAVAARWLLEQNVALGHDDLARETAKALGFPRLGEKIAEAMRAGIAKLAADGRCVLDGERVRLA
jgi:serine/threonine protein kinase